MNFSTTNAWQIFVPCPRCPRQLSSNRLLWLIQCPRDTKVFRCLLLSNSLCLIADMFVSLVPVQVHNAMLSYDGRKAELVNMETGRLREHTQLMNGSV